jgi:hypothetical protein
MTDPYTGGAVLRRLSAELIAIISQTPAPSPSLAEQLERGVAVLRCPAESVSGARRFRFQLACGLRVVYRDRVRAIGDHDAGGSWLVSRPGMLFVRARPGDARAGYVVPNDRERWVSADVLTGLDGFEPASRP